jgi:hypothetical protein
MASDNPFWFGYYPGDKPLVKRPPKIFPGPQMDFSQVAPEQLAVALDYYLEDIASGVKNTMDLPKWLWDKTIDDWKNSFKASAMGYTPSGASTFEFSGAEGADIPGVNVGINLYDLVTNPQKTLEKFIQKQVIAGIDPLRSGEFWTDLDTALTKRLYVDIAKENGNSLVQSAISTTNKDPVSFINQKVYAEGKVYSSDEATPGSPGASTRMVEGETDVYQKVGESFAGFVMDQKTSARRGRAYGRLQADFIKAASTELEQKKTSIHDAIWALGPIAHLEADMAERFVDTFVDEASVVEALGNYSARFTAPWGFSGALARKAFVGRLSWDTSYGNVAVAEAAAKAAGDKKTEEAASAMKSLKTNAELMYKLDSTTHIATGEVANVRKSITNARTQLKARESTPLSPAEGKRYKERLADFNTRVQPIEDLMDRVEQLALRVSQAVDSGEITRAGLESLIREQTALATKMSHLRYGGGIYNQYVTAISREYFEREDFGRNKYFTLTDPTTGRPIMSQGFRSIDPIYRYSKGQYLRQDGEDLIEALIAGKYLERRYWAGKWRNYIQAYTPRYWTEKVLKRVGYFGLVYDEGDELALFLNPKDPVTDEDIHNFKHRMGRVIRPFTRYNHFNASFDVLYSGKRITAGGKFEGGLYLSYLQKAWLRTDPANNAKLVGIVDATTGNWTSVGLAAKQKQALIYLINGNTAGFETLTGLKYQMAAVGPDFNNAKIKGALLFRKKILKNKKLVESLGFELDAAGNLIDNEKNIAILDGFFGKLGEMDRDTTGVISPFIAKVGLFNWMSAKLTRIQAFEARLLAPFIKPLIILREGIKNLAGKIFHNALYALLGTVTGGAGVFLMKTLGPFLEKVFNATMARFMRYFSDGLSKAFKALLKGDISKAIDALAEGAAKMLAWAMACGCSIPILLILLVMFIMTPFMASISPVDRSKAATSSASAGGTPYTVPRDTITGSNCPIKSSQLSLGSYTVGGGYTNAAGHGSRYYWENIFGGGTASLFSIPYLSSVSGFPCPGGNCSPSDPAPYELENPMNMPGAPLKAVNSTPYYGFAADFASGNTDVYAPNKVSCGGIDAPVASWAVTGTVLTSFGCGVVLNSDTSRYKMLLLHVNICTGGGCSCYSGKTYTAGTGITTLWPQGGNTHVHTEITDAGIPQRPEECVCR